MLEVKSAGCAPLTSGEGARSDPVTTVTISVPVQGECSHRTPPEADNPDTTGAVRASP